MHCPPLKLKSLEINTFKCVVGVQPISYTHSSGYQQSKQPLEQQARFLGQFQADKTGAGGDDQGKNQLWPEGIDEKERESVPVNGANDWGLSDFFNATVGAHAKQWLGFQEIPFEIPSKEEWP